MSVDPYINRCIRRWIVRFSIFFSRNKTTAHLLFYLISFRFLNNKIIQLFVVVLHVVFRLQWARSIKMLLLLHKKQCAISQALNVVWSQLYWEIDFILVNDIMSMFHPFHHFSLFFFTIHKFWNGALYMICQKLAVKTSKNRPVTPLLLSHQFEIEKIWLRFFLVFSGDFFLFFHLYGTDSLNRFHFISLKVCSMFVLNHDQWQ